MWMVNSIVKNIRVEWARGKNNVQSKDIIISSMNSNPQDMTEV